MSSYIENTEELTLNNDNFRQVLFDEYKHVRAAVALVLVVEALGSSYRPQK